MPAARAESFWAKWPLWAALPLLRPVEAVPDPVGAGGQPRLLRLRPVAAEGQFRVVVVGLHQRLGAREDRRHFHSPVPICMGLFCRDTKKIRDWKMNFQPWEAAVWGSRQF